MPEAEVDVHLDLCLYEQTEREEVAQAHRLRQQPPRRSTGSLPATASASASASPTDGGSGDTRSRSASDRRDRQPPHTSSSSPLAASSMASPFNPAFPAVPTHTPLNPSSAFPSPAQSQQPHSSNGGYMGFPLSHHQPQPPLVPLSASGPPLFSQQQQQRAGQQPPVQFATSAAAMGGPPPMYYYPAQTPSQGGFPPAGFQVGPAPPGSTGPPSARQPYQPFSVPPTTAQNVQPFSPFTHLSTPPPQQPPSTGGRGPVGPQSQPLLPPGSQQAPPLSQQQQQQRYPASYFPSQPLPHAQPVQFQQQQQQQQQQPHQQPTQAQYPVQQYYAVTQQLTPQYQAFLQRYQSLQQNQSFSQFPQILQKTPSQQSFLLPAASSQQDLAAAADRERAQSERLSHEQQRTETPVYYEYCDGWVFVCERPSVRFLKSWVVLKEAGLCVFDTPSSSRPRLVIPLARVKAFLVDAQKNTGKKHSFGLQCKDDKIFYFATRSAEELLPWLQSVRKELRRMAETSPAGVKEIVPTAEPTNTTPEPKKPKERSKRENKPREKKSTPEKSKEGKTKDRNGTFSGLFAKLSSIAAGSGDDKMYKLLDEEFLKQLKEDGTVEEGKTLTQQQLDSQKAQIFSHMNKVFGLYSHPLGKLMIDFTGEFLRHKDRILSARPSTALAKITQEIQTFLDRLIITVEHYYGGEVAHVEQFVHTARLAAEHYVFSTLYDIIYPVYTKRYIAEDRKFTQKMVEFADITTSDLIDNPKLWLLDDKKSATGRSGSEPYQKAINMMAAITELATPVAKLNCLVDTSRIICGCVNEYWTRRDPTASEIAVSCDDLLPILLYVVIKSKLSTVHTESMYMQDFIGEREQMQIEGYSLATFQAASAALLCLERDSLRKDAKPEEGATANSPTPAPLSSSPPSPVPLPASLAPSSPTTDAAAAASTPAPGGAQSQRAHRSRRASWISSVLAQQAAIPLEPARDAPHAGSEPEEEGDDDWTFFKSGAAAAVPPSPMMGRRHSSAEEEEFIDSFRPLTVSDAARSPGSPAVNLLIDWDSDHSDGSAAVSHEQQDNAKAPKREEGEREEAHTAEEVEELGSDDPTTSDGEEENADEANLPSHPTAAAAAENGKGSSAQPVSCP